MKLFDFTLAPNPRRVRIFAAEKGINLQNEQVDLLQGKSRTPEFLAINPAGGIPVLQLDDGSYLAESNAIAHYLESLHPEPNLCGRDALERATIEMWERRMELNLFTTILRAFLHLHPMNAPRLKQLKEYGESQVATTNTQLEWLDRQLKGKEFIAGPRFTIADITAFVGIEFGIATAGIKVAPALAELSRWHRAVSSRPSAKA
jgi:glutathione S-transferase